MGARRPAGAPCRSVAVIAWLLALPQVAHAQARPLQAESAEPLAAGEVRVAVGGTWSHDYEEPVYGLTGTLVELPQVEAGLGLGGVAELQVSGGLRTIWISDRNPGPLAPILDIPGDRSSAPQDMVVATKVRLLGARGRRPVLGLRLATKLPNAGNESGLGTDTTDFTVLLLASWKTRRWSVDANLGTGIIGDPSQIGVQHDPMLYAFGVAHSIGRRTELAGEVAGRWLPSHPSRPGSEDRAETRLGVRHEIGRVRVDAAVILGMTGIDAPVGMTAGATWRFTSR